MTKANPIAAAPAIPEVVSSTTPLALCQSVSVETIDSSRLQKNHMIEVAVNNSVASHASFQIPNAMKMSATTKAIHCRGNLLEGFWVVSALKIFLSSCFSEGLLVDQNQFVLHFGQVISSRPRSLGIRSFCPQSRPGQIMTSELVSTVGPPRRVRPAAADPNTSGLECV